MDCAGEDGGGEDCAGSMTLPNDIETKRKNQQEKLIFARMIASLFHIADFMLCRYRRTGTLRVRKVALEGR